MLLDLRGAVQRRYSKSGHCSKPSVRKETWLKGRRKGPAADSNLFSILSAIK